MAFNSIAQFIRYCDRFRLYLLFFLPVADPAADLEEDRTPPGTAAEKVLVKDAEKSPTAIESAFASAKLKPHPPCTSKFSTVSMYCRSQIIMLPFLCYLKK